MNFSQTEREVILITNDACPFSSQMKNNIEHQNRTLDSLSELERETLIMTTARVILFLGSNQVPLEKKKVVDVAMKQYMSNNNAKAPQVTNAVFSQASKRVTDIYGYVVRRAPVENMTLAKKYEDRFYLINPMKDATGKHSKTIHENTMSGAKGLLMVILGLAYCKGTVRGGTKGKIASRWLNAESLYALLHAIDDRFPQRPPLHIKGSSSSSKVHVEGLHNDVESLIELYVSQDFLLKAKEEQQENFDGTLFCYAMGPRSLLEIGRRQLLQFVAEVLDEEPDPTMLQEIDGNSDDDLDEDEEEDSVE